MRALIFGLLLLAALFARAAAEPYKFDALGFEVAFPVEPEVSAGEIEAPSGPTKVTRFRAWSGDLRASLTVIQYSFEEFNPDDLGKALDASREQQLAQSGGRLVSESDLAVDGGAGREFVIEVTHNGQIAHYRVRTIYLRNRQYLQSVIGSPDEVRTDAAEAYFASFRAWN
ncbi:MAG: hypothetical protein Tsb0010_10940 [Parvularculaceae bacterium]